MLELHYLSPDGEMGFPGNLDVTVRYTVEAKNGLKIEYNATTDKPTVLNLTNHSYFNLAGAGSGQCFETPVDDSRRSILRRLTSGLIPTGSRTGVEGTPFDFPARQRNWLAH